MGDGGDPNSALFEWFRYYAPALVLTVVAGLAVAGVTYLLTPRLYEMGSIVVETKGAIPAQSVGGVTAVLSRSATVYDEAGRILELPSPERKSFLDRHAEVRPVPGSNVVLVIGRSESRKEAARISSAMAAALIKAVREETGIQAMRLFSEPRTVEAIAGFSLSAILFLGSGVGLFAGLGLCVLHYRLRRPVLSLNRALAILAADEVEVIDSPTRLSRLLGPRRSTLPNTAKNRVALSRLGLSTKGHRREARATSGILASRTALKSSLERAMNTGRTDSNGASGAGADIVIVADPGSSERELSLRRFTSNWEERLTLVWLR